MPDELRRGNRAGADFLLSLTEDDARHRGRERRRAGADPGQATATWPRCCAPPRRPSARGIRPSPIRCSIRSISASSTSLPRYAELRRRLPGRRDPDGHRQPHRADRRRLAAASPRCCSASARSLQIRNVLCVQVSPHTRRTIEEHDAARRMMFAAREDASLPHGLRRARCCSCTTASRFPNTPDEIAETAGAGARREFPHRGRRGRHPRLQRRRPPRRAGCAVAVPEARRRDATARMPSISAPS